MDDFIFKDRTKGYMKPELQRWKGYFYISSLVLVSSLESRAPPHHTYHVPGNRASSKNVWCDLEAPLPGTNICDPSLQVYIGYQLGSQVVPCNGVSNVSLHYMVVSVIPVSNVISGRMGSQSHSYLILHCVLDTGFTSSLLYQRYYLMIPYQQAFHVNNWNQRIRVNDLYKPIVHSKCLLT